MLQKGQADTRSGKLIPATRKSNKAVRRHKDIPAISKLQEK
jgi:hypothetical protein